MNILNTLLYSASKNTYRLQQPFFKIIINYDKKVFMEKCSICFESFEFHMIFLLTAIMSAPNNAANITMTILKFR